MTRTTIVMAAGLALVAALPAIPALAAARDRVFVASYGSDSNPCTFGSPCKTFQQAVNVVAAGGEVTAIDSAGFGPINISHAVTITSPAGIEAGIVPVAGGDAIDINAGATDAIVLRGLTLNGSGTGYNGVVFNSGGSLTVSDCVVQNFFYNGSETTGNGILIQPSSGTITFAVTNSILSNNGFVGIYYLPPSGSAFAIGAIDHVEATNNDYGIAIKTTLGGVATAVTTSNSVASNNATAGFFIQNYGEPLAVSIDSTSISGNTYYGIQAFSTSRVTLGRSVITSNFGVGIDNATSPNSFYSYQDNRINENCCVDDVVGPQMIPYALK